jgi:mRNA interferase MazF
MKRGELYRVHRPKADPKTFRTYVILSRQAAIGSRFPTVICAPVFSNGEGLATQVRIGIDEGMRHPSWILCDNLLSIEKSALAQCVGSLSAAKLAELNRAIAIAVDLP